MGAVLQDLHRDLGFVRGGDGTYQGAILLDLFCLSFVPNLVLDPARPLRSEAEDHVKVLPVLEDAVGFLQVWLPLAFRPGFEGG